MKINKTKKCSACGQIDRGQTGGAFHCPKCGLPRIHDEEGQMINIKIGFIETMGFLVIIGAIISAVFSVLIKNWIALIWQVITILWIIQYIIKSK